MFPGPETTGRDTAADLTSGAVDERTGTSLEEVEAEAEHEARECVTADAQERDHLIERRLVAMIMARGDGDS